LQKAPARQRGDFMKRIESKVNTRSPEFQANAAHNRKLATS